MRSTFMTQELVALIAVQFPTLPWSRCVSLPSLRSSLILILKVVENNTEQSPVHEPHCAVLVPCLILEWDDSVNHFARVQQLYARLNAHPPDLCLPGWCACSHMEPVPMLRVKFSTHHRCCRWMSDLLFVSCFGPYFVLFFDARNRACIAPSNMLILVFLWHYRRIAPMISNSQVSAPWDTGLTTCLLPSDCYNYSVA